jgi:hypothetical protein
MRLTWENGVFINQYNRDFTNTGNVYTQENQEMVVELAQLKTENTAHKSEIAHLRGLVERLMDK